jgi:hypothetical protein
VLGTNQAKLRKIFSTNKQDCLEAIKIEIMKFYCPSAGAGAGAGSVVPAPPSGAAPSLGVSVV